MKHLSGTVLLALITATGVMAEAPKRSGKATAQWLVAKQAPGVVHTVVRLEVDDPWHVYWYNPGGAGMETSAKLKLPENWLATRLLHPVPKRFKTGDLHGFGHEGRVDYRLTLFIPQTFKGDAELEATISWLSCNDDACIPGEMTLKLKVVDGKVLGPQMNPKAYAKTELLFPKHKPHTDEILLKLSDKQKHWELTIENPDKMQLDPANTEVFVETQELVPASANVKFKKQGDLWLAQFPKGEFAPKKPDSFAIVLAEKGKRPVRLLWVRR